MVAVGTIDQYFEMEIPGTYFSIAGEELQTWSDLKQNLRKPGQYKPNQEEDHHKSSQHAPEFLHKEGWGLLIAEEEHFSPKNPESEHVLKQGQKFHKSTRQHLLDEEDIPIFKETHNNHHHDPSHSHHHYERENRQFCKFKVDKSRSTLFRMSLS